MDKLAIVILNWNGAKMLAQYLPTVMKYSRDEATVYVADNASTDDSLELLRREFPECRLIVLEIQRMDQYTACAGTARRSDPESGHDV